MVFAFIIFKMFIYLFLIKASGQNFVVSPFYVKILFVFKNYIM